MSVATFAPSTSSQKSWARVFKHLDPLAIAACGAIIVGVGLRLFALPNMPLWLDEAWTGGIIAQDSLQEVLRHSLLDTSAPLYFVVMHSWSLLFGLSNDALRFPSILFSALAPIVLLIPTKVVAPPVRYLWCVLLAFWVPAVWYAQEARCYALLLLLSTACTIAYARLLAEPSVRRATLWTLLGTLAILTHYHALMLLGLQGLAYLALHRWRAVRTWPAALFFALALPWMVLHLPRVAAYTDPAVAWYSRLEAADLVGVAVFVAGCAEALIGLAFFGLICVALVVVQKRARHASAAAGTTEPAASPTNWIVAAMGTLGMVLVLVAAAVSTSFTNRYLIPFVPSVMFGLALGAIRLSRTWTAIPMSLAAIFAASAPMWATSQKNAKIYNFEVASDALMAANIHHLVFLFDNPIGKICDPDQLKALGGFFFRRAGHPVAVEPVTVRPEEDVNQKLLAAANAEQQSGILWMYDLGVQGTAARWHPPSITERDSAWDCRQFGRGQLGVLACHRRI